mgnify:CR=1 FL=1
MKLTPLGDKVVLKAIKEEEKTKSGIYSKYSGTEVTLEDEDFIIVSQSDILAIVE